MTKEQKVQCKKIIYATCVIANTTGDFGNKSIDHPCIQGFVIHMIVSIAKVFEKEVDVDKAHNILDGVKSRKNVINFLQILPKIFGDEFLVDKKIREIGWEVAHIFEQGKA